MSHPYARRGLILRAATPLLAAALLAAPITAVASADAASATPAPAAPTTTRISGPDRYQTAVDVAQSGYPTGAPVVFLASGENFPDALAAGPAAAKLGGPLLLTAPTALPGSVEKELAALAPSKVYLVGGPAAVSAAVESAAQRAVPRAAVSRLAGSDRYATGRAVIQTAFPTASTVFIATGAGFADALSAAAAAGSAGEPVVMVNGAAATLDSATVAQLKKLKATDAVIAGGPSAVSTGIQSQLDTLLGGTKHVTRLGGADRYATSALIGQHSFPHATTAFFASGVQFPDALAASAVAGAEHAPLFTVQSTCVPNETAGALGALGVTKVTLVGGPAALSAQVAALSMCQAAEKFSSAPTPKITGTAVVGGTLTVNPGTWSPVPTSLTFQWSRAGAGSSTFAKITGATGASYAIPDGDSGDTFKVAVTARRFGRATTSTSSAATAVTSGELSLVAGIGSSPIAGPALNSPINPAGVAVDAAGDLFIADPEANVIEEVTSGGTLSVVAGNGTTGEPLAGQALSSPLGFVEGVAVDAAGNLYIDDELGYIEKVTPAHVLSVIAGNGGDGKPSAGPATSRSISPTGVAVDAAGDVYISDQDGYVLKVTPSSSPTTPGALSIVAGNGKFNKPVAGPALQSSVGIGNLAVDASGDVYLADMENSVVEEITPAGTLSIVAGTGGALAHDPTPGPALSSSLSPAGIAVDAAGNLFISDDVLSDSVENATSGDVYVVEVSTAGTLSIVAGDGTSGTPTPGQATQSALGLIDGVAVDAADNLYLADGDGLIDKVDATGQLSEVAGIGSAAIPGPATSSPVAASAVAVDPAGDLFIADETNSEVEEVTPAGTLSVIAGNGTSGDPVAGPALDSPLGDVAAIALDSAGDIYIGDGDGYVEKVTSAGTLSVIAGDGGANTPVAGPALDTSIDPAALAVDKSGDVFIADGSNNVVEKVTPSGALSIVAGDGDDDVPMPGKATSSPLGMLSGIAIDGSGNLYLADAENSDVEKVTPAGTLSIVVNSDDDESAAAMAAGDLVAVQSVAVNAAGTLYVGDGSGYVDVVSGSGMLTPIAGNGGQSGAPQAGPSLNTVLNPNALAFDQAGHLYIADPTFGYVEKVVL